MSEHDPIKLFVTHAFVKTADFLRLFEYLETASNFFYLNYADPEVELPTGGREAMKDELRRQIEPAEAVVVLSGLYADEPDWVQYQLDCAGAMDKPVVVVEPFGGVAGVPQAVRERADEVVPWNDRNIVDAIRRQARHEDTQRWEVIDFP